MPDLSARLDLPFLMPAQAQKHVTHNEALTLLDLLVQLGLQGLEATDPPAVPETGQIWALGPAPTGAWAGQGGKLAAWVDGAWLFVTPRPGWCAALIPEGALRIFDGTDWVAVSADALDNLPGLGVNTAHDATNRLAVASPASLFSHEGAGHQLKIDKAAPADTASLLFQTGFSGRAEMGTAGGDDWSLKVSPDGSTWHTALVANRNTGAVTLGAPLALASGGTGAATAASARGNLGLGSAATATATTSPTDTTANRVLRVGAGHQQLDATLYRRGNILGAVNESGGVPTGALMQRGSNVNGAFLRLADGTQICWRVVEHDFSTNSSQNWIYPAAFSASHPVVGSWALSQPGIIAVGLIYTKRFVAWIRTDNPMWRTRAPEGAEIAATVDVTLLAIGRWF